MEIDKKLFFIAGTLTLILFILIYSFNIFIGSQREKALSEKMDVVIDEYEEIQTLSLMSELYGNDITCLSLQSMMSEMDKSLWDLGIKLDKYRKLTSEYLNDPFYLAQKKKFNRREVLYYSLLENTKKSCELKTTTILFFYEKKEECPDCDGMSFVLTDLKKDVENEISVFSFDRDLNLSSINVLANINHVDSYPCLVIGNQTHCGLFDKSTLISLICEKEKSFSKCIN